jgi:hypothetical protein
LSVTLHLDYLLSSVKYVIFTKRAGQGLFFLGGLYIAYMLAAQRDQVFEGPNL